MSDRDAICPERDLVLERTIDVDPARVWAAWTRPELMMRWFTPAPWETVACEIDPRPGGIFSTTMRSPEGEVMPSDAGCILEAIENRKLVFTDALGPGFRPKGSAFMTATILMTPEGAGTRYTAIVRHADAASRERHEEMGFSSGWGQALDQLVALMRTRPRGDEKR